MNFPDLIQQGGAHAWLFIPTAILLGALHGLEPGHSKTMMAAFIIAVRGTVAQAVLLGVSAAISHSLVIWALALVGLYFGGQFDVERYEPAFQLVTGLIIMATAVWMFWRTRAEERAERAHSHSHAYEHERGGHEHDHQHDHAHEHAEHSGDSQPRKSAGAEYEDAHQREHSAEIAARFQNRSVTTGQIVLFGLTGGLLPCPASLTVLLVCLQLKKFTLGFSLVLAFSVGLAITLVAAGAFAAWSVGHARRRWAGFDALARRLPYLSAIVLSILGLYFAIHGWSALPV